LSKTPWVAFSIKPYTINAISQTLVRSATWLLQQPTAAPAKPAFIFAGHIGLILPPATV
jgi:hypothetical protein